MKIVSPRPVTEFTTDHQIDYRNALLDAIAKKRRKNNAYSLRAYARDLGVSPAALSQVLAGKRDFSKKNLLRVASALAFSPAQTEYALKCISSSFGPTERIQDAHFLQLRDDAFRMISDWYCYAILSIAETTCPKSDPAWIAKRLRITKLEAKAALARLQRMNLIEIRRSRIYRTSRDLKTTDDLPSSAIREYHKQNLRLAELSLDRDGIEQRDITSITVAADPANLKKAKELIKDFRRKLSALMESGQRTEVYTIAIQLFPVTKKGE